MRGAARKRSTSEGEEDRLSSTLNLPEAVPIHRFNEFNAERCVSTHHINITGFMDDNFESNRGTRLESRIRTRSRGGSNSIDIRLRNDFARLKAEIIEWGEFACNSAQTVDVIENKHSAFYAEIEQQISEVLLTRGDFSLVGELANLKDRLNVIRRRAKQVSMEQQEGSYYSDVSIPAQTADATHPLTVMMTGYDQDYVFHDDPIQRDSPYSTVSAPIYRGRDELNLSKGGNSVMVGAGPVSSGPSSSRLIQPQSSYSHNTPGRRAATTESGINLRDITVTRARESVMGGTGSVLAEPGPHRLNTPAFSRLNEIPPRRILDGDLSLSIDELVAGIPGMNKDQGEESSSDQWMKMMKIRQNLVEEKLERFQRGFRTIVTTVQGAESMYRTLQEDVEDLKSNSSEIWQRLKSDEQRLDKMQSSLEKLEFKLDEKVEIIQEWFVDLTTRASPEVPAEIVNSIQEIISDSAPGAAVSRLRVEIEDIRDSMNSSKHATEGLRGLVIDLSEQVASTSFNATVHEARLPEKEPRPTETSIREREIVRKGIERAEKQLKQIISNDLNISSKDISLIKKHKTVDVPAIHSAVGNIQKSLQKYIKFPGIDYDYCDAINEFMDSAENWCLKVEELYNKAEVHSINTSKGDSADVGVFSDNAKVTIYEFFESAEIAYLGWGNSVQKANRLYNKHLSDEIKAKLINMSDSYGEMRDWLILNYGRVSRIVSDILNDQ